MTDTSVFDTCTAAADRLTVLSSLLRNRGHIRDLDGNCIDDCLYDLIERQLEEISSCLYSVLKTEKTITNTPVGQFVVPK